MKSFALFLAPLALAASCNDAEPKLVPANKAAAPANGITVDKPYLNMSMATRPSKKFSGFFSSSTLLFEDCETPEFYHNHFEQNITKQVKVYGIPDQKANKPSLTHAVTVKDRRNGTTTYKFNIIETGRTLMRYGYGSGDPHFRLFNGQSPDDQTFGTLIMYWSPLLEVQAKTVRCGSVVTCINEVAVRYGSQWVKVNNAGPSKSGLPTYGFSFEKAGTKNHAEHQWIADDGAVVTYLGSVLYVYVPSFYSKIFPSESGVLLATDKTMKNFAANSTQDFFAATYKPDPRNIDAPLFFQCNGALPLRKNILI